MIGRPNAAMRRSFGGDSILHHITVDARGAGDPAAVNVAVHRATRAYVPQIIMQVPYFGNLFWTLPVYEHYSPPRQLIHDSQLIRIYSYAGL